MLPNHNTFTTINRQLRQNDLLNVNRHDCGWQRYVCIPRFERAVLNVVIDTPLPSTRSLAVSPISLIKKWDSGPNRQQEFRHWCFQCHVVELWYPNIVLCMDEGPFTRESVTKNLSHLYRFSISLVWHCTWFSLRPYIFPVSLTGLVCLYWCWMFSKGCGSYMLSLQIISAWMCENTWMLHFPFVVDWAQRRRWEDNIKMDLQEVGRGCGDWMELAQDRDRWRTLVSTVMNFWVP